MTLTTWILLAVVGSFVAPWVVSFIVDGLRSKPVEPESFSWSPDAKPRYADLDGVRVRYSKTGSGPNLVLFHTLRTQSDIFYKMVPTLAQDFTVYTVDYPGHGWSDIPDTDFHPEEYYDWMTKFLDRMDVTDATVGGISIGGVIALKLAARHNLRIVKVFAVNPGDFKPSLKAGINSSSPLAKVIFSLANIPFVGETIMRLRNLTIERKIFEGGVADADALEDDIFGKLFDAGNREGFQRGFIRQLRHNHLWQDARKDYGKINIPALAVYGDQDWAPQAERDRTIELIPQAQSKVVRNGRHFLSLDRPVELTEIIRDFAANT